MISVVVEEVGCLRVTLDGLVLFQITSCHAKSLDFLLKFPSGDFGYCRFKSYYFRWIRVTSCQATSLNVLLKFSSGDFDYCRIKSDVCFAIRFFELGVSVTSS